jgi:hypothetical protein
MKFMAFSCAGLRANQPLGHSQLGVQWYLSIVSGEAGECWPEEHSVRGLAVVLVRAPCGGRSESLASASREELFLRTARSQFDLKRLETAKVKVSGGGNDQGDEEQEGPSKELGIRDVTEQGVLLCGE